jgi:hypothetical protein
MKTIFCTLFLLCAPAAFSQTAATLSSVPAPLEMSDHTQHASPHALAQETSLLSTSVYSYAKGEQPLVDVGSLDRETPLGDVARAYKKQRAALPPSKPAIVLEK